MEIWLVNYYPNNKFNLVMENCNNKLPLIINKDKVTYYFRCN